MQRLRILFTTLVTFAALTLAASAVHAGGINLAWSDCGTFGQSSQTFACTANTGAPHILIVSCVPPAPMAQLNGTTVTLDMQVDQPTLSEWWQMGAGGCRASAFSGTASFVTGPFSCTDVWAGGASGGTNWNPGFNGANRARFKATYAISGNTSVNATDELYLVEFIFTNAKTTGTGACTGCTDGACIVLNDVLITQPLGVGDYHVSNPINSQHVTWQTNTFTSLVCPDDVPTRNKTWGQVKSLYR